MSWKCCTIELHLLSNINRKLHVLYRNMWWPWITLEGDSSYCKLLAGEYFEICCICRVIMFVKVKKVIHVVQTFHHRLTEFCRHVAATKWLVQTANVTAVVGLPSWLRLCQVLTNNTITALCVLCFWLSDELVQVTNRLLFRCAS